MTMGKGLGAILRAPEKLKHVDSDEIVAKELITPQATTDAVTTRENGSAEETTREIAALEVHDGEVATEGKITAKITNDAVTTVGVITDRVTTTLVTTGGVTIRQDIIAKAISDAKRSPRISTWSPVAVGTLKSLWMTQPQFSMSDEIRTLIEEGLARKYPELVQTIKKELEKSG